MVKKVTIENKFVLFLNKCKYYIKYIYYTYAYMYKLFKKYYFYDLYLFRNSIDMSIFLNCITIYCTYPIGLALYMISSERN